jgi:choline dehydrogenase-like flavoprotein
MEATSVDFDAIVIGSGFGGTVATTQLVGAGKKVLVLERGAWWVSPVGLARPPKTPAGMTMRKWLETVRTPELHRQGRRSTEHLLNFWPRPDHTRGLFDLVASIRTRWNPDGLYSYRRFEEAHIPTANGVGGGSLIYSNVTIEPNPATLRRIGLNLAQADYDGARSWMQHFRGPTNQIVTKSPPVPGLNLDLANLDGAHEYLYLDKSLALKTAAPQTEQELGLKLPWQPLDLSIIDYDPASTTTAADGTPTPASEADKAHTYCQRQGRCLFGCLPQARHTLNKTLWSKVLTDPQFANLIELRELAQVVEVRAVEDGYEVVYRDRMADEREVRVQAPKVFLAAGTLGTTELLLRCAEEGSLRLSKTVGHGFSTNGDFGGFAVGTQMKVHSTQGPINTCHLDVELPDGTRVTIEDSGLPAMVAELARYGLHIQQLYLEENRRWRRWWFKLRMRLFWHVGRRLHLRHPRLPHFLPRPVRARGRANTSMAQFGADPHSPANPAVQAWAGGAPASPPPTVGAFPWPSPDWIPKTTDPARYQTEAEMVEDIFFFNSMGMDEANGTFRLKNGKLDLSWERPVSEQKVFEDIEKIQRSLAKWMGGTYLPMPFWDGFTKKKLVIPHPLGGCRIGRDRDQGVVDEHGRVFDGGASDPAGTLPGLYIVDGSVIPGALAVNPTLTITAQALKTMAAALQE